MASHKLFINFLFPGRCKRIFENPISKDGCTSCAFLCKYIGMDPTNLKLILDRIMDWCCQAASHYQSQYWPNSMSPYSVTRHITENRELPWFQILSSHVPSHVALLKTHAGTNGDKVGIMIPFLIFIWWSISFIYLWFQNFARSIWPPGDHFFVAWRSVSIFSPPEQFVSLTAQLMKKRKLTPQVRAREHFTIR